MSYPPQQGYPAAQQGYPAPQQGYVAQQPGLYPAVQQQGYPAAQQQGYPVAQQGYPAQQQGYPVAQQGYPAAQQGYPAPQQGYTQQPGVVSTAGVPVSWLIPCCLWFFHKLYSKITRHVYINYQGIHGFNELLVQKVNQPAPISSQVGGPRGT